MITPPIPHNEAERLKTLKALNVLDSIPEEPFDRVTRLARRLFDVPIVLISLVDETRQWFKSRQGLDASETPRDIAFCGHTILGDEIMVVQDALYDERFHDNPLVTDGPEIRFYAGCPLEVANGHKMGTLCLIDKTPRELTAEDLSLLQDLAAIVAQNLVALDMATTDELTNIFNRRGFNMSAETALNTCRRLNRRISVLSFDLNDFKVINDRLGHAEGDNALRDFADCMWSTFRECDVVGRTGGDEFSAFLGGVEELVVQDLLARLEKKVQASGYQNGRPFRIKFSVGAYSCLPGTDTTLDALMERADALMYENKKGTKENPELTASWRDTPPAWADDRMTVSQVCEDPRTIDAPPTPAASWSGPDDHAR